ncbi:GntR family transcriptional regulator [Vagococcus coleopterorum]|uniref:GntR family transcriptional regulator n=1 Tax=Vagococcus coleopterorum TaxID=2714946 RepID=A0A6G8AM47_9ENTE|nr:GntR family transcriptional regulator [Vagococcus coleopterorum]QIL46151.1 GntR family transcriptional regulator [Vagococcus coleopterorum]
MEEKNRGKKHVAFPRYQQVALEIAERIVENRYKFGEKIHARSTLASNFNVSPETARKAINVLVDLDIMEVRHGSGSYVASRENAQRFVEKYKHVQSVQEVKKDILESVTRQKEELNHFSELLNDLVSQTSKVHHMLPFAPYELIITSEAVQVEKSIVELNIWQETGATIVAIQTGSELLVSPGPYAKIKENDTIYFVGDESALQRMTSYFYPNN